MSSNPYVRVRNTAADPMYSASKIDLERKCWSDCGKVKCIGDFSDILDIYQIYEIYCTYGKHTTCKMNSLDKENAKGGG